MMVNVNDSMSDMIVLLGSITESKRDSNKNKNLFYVHKAM